jgi:hypothetical protein
MLAICADRRYDRFQHGKISNAASPERLFRMTALGKQLA